MIKLLYLKVLSSIPSPPKLCLHATELRFLSGTILRPMSVYNDLVRTVKKTLESHNFLEARSRGFFSYNLLTEGGLIQVLSSEQNKHIDTSI